MAGALARPPNKGKKPARDVKGKGKIGPAVRGRGVQARQVRRQTYEEELKELEQRLEELNPAASTSKSAITKFSELPITQATLAGLDSAYFHNTTSIQGRSLPYSLKGHDILASARTGSGKTLAFIIPVLERLYRAKWGPNDGLGALVISPTRELAVQIFDVLRKIGHLHSFSAGLVIGGKSLRDEQERLSRMNILIATPGRLLQHMDQTLSFDVSNLQILVLDEADRILDLGFSKTIDAIVSNFPPSGRGLQGGRQTLLFSATQTDSIQALARLSLSDPVYISVRNQDNDTNAITNTEGEGDASTTNANANQVAESSTTNGKNGFNQYETPANLEQFYMIVDLDRKIDVLWTFIKSHLGCKTLVFLSSCKQVRFIYEAFRHLRPGISLLHLHGKQKQSKRLEIYAKFTASSHAVLFATDIASRGLDFPNVNWVVQMDCPEDVQSYVHRVGRTARYNSKGKALLMLLPSEKAGFEKRLRDKKLLANDGEEDDASSKGKLKPIKMNAQKKDQSIAKQIQSLLFKFNELKTLSQKSFVSYLRSIYMQKDKSTFRINDIANDKALLERYAKSIGLAGSPRIKFKGQQKEKEMKEKKNRPRAVEMLEAEAAKMPEHGTKKIFGAADNDDTADGGAAARLSKNDGDDEYPETSDEEASDPEKAENSDDDDEGAELDEATSEDSDHEASTSQKNGKPAFPSKKKNSKASTKLVGNDDEDEDDGDFLTLAPKQRHLELDVGDIPAASSSSGSKDILPLDHDDISKRKLKQGVTKKGLMALRGSGEKLVFDDEGTAHALYELVDDKTLTREEIEEERRRFVAEQGGKMKDVDVLDKEAIKALRREKKTARKAREREVDGRQKADNQNDEDDGPMLEDDEGEVVPDFDDIDLPSESEDEVMRRQPGKRKAEVQEDEEDDLEAMALQALRKKGRRS